MALPVAAAIGAQILSGTLQNGVQTWMQDKSYRKNQRYANKMQLQQARSMPLAEREGLINAGMSPAMFSGNFGGNVAQPNAPMAQPGTSTDVAGIMSAVAQTKQVNQQTKLLKAETDLREQEVSLKRVQVEREANKDATADINLRAYLREQHKFAKTDEEREYWQKMLDSPNSYNIGNLEALRSHVQMQKEISETSYYRLKNKFDSIVLEKMHDRNAEDFIAQMPEKEKERISEEIAEIGARIVKMSAETDLTTKQKDKIAQDIVESMQRVRTMQNKDFVGKVDSGEYGDAFLMLLNEGMQAFSAGFGHGAARATTKH